MELSKNIDSDARSQAAYLASIAFIEHDGPIDENAALYAALFTFLEDNSVKVRASLAYGLLHSKNAPRPIMVSLLYDEPIISRAVAQYSPVLVDADLLGIIRNNDEAMLDSIVRRKIINERVSNALLLSGNINIILRLLKRKDVSLDSQILAQIAKKFANNRKISAALLARDELSASTRIYLIESLCDRLAKARIVKGSIIPSRLNRLMRDLKNSALTSIGEREACNGQNQYAKEMIENNQINARIMLHSIISGDVLFFAQCLAILANLPEDKIFSLLNSGSKSALNALFAKCGLNEAIARLLIKLIFYARNVDLSNDLGARHLIVTCLINELIEENKGDIPLELEEAFSYLNEQNILLAQKAAAGVMPAFALEAESKILPLPNNEEEEKLSLPAA